MYRTKGIHVAGFVLCAGLFGFYAGCAGSAGTANRPEVNTVTKEDAGRTPNKRLADLIVERVAGINLTETGDGRLQVRLRGPSSFTSDTQPLFVVDDVPVDPNPDGSLPGVLVTEIEEIRVLKDPVDTSRYGMRGAHGVIVVKTRSGRG